MSTTEPTVPEPQSLDAGTDYIVLRQVDGGWRTSGKPVIGRNANDAIKNSAGQVLSEVTTFVAVPCRSWNPVRVTPIVTTTLKVEDAS